MGSAYCPSCGSRLNHLEGFTGRISICTRCGWNRVELARERERRGRSARQVHPVAVRQLKPS